MASSPDAVADQIIQVVPLVTRALRAQMRRYPTPGLSLPQFRTLGFLDVHPGASLSDAAAYLGVTLPSMSKMVDGLVEQKLATREFDATDRRRVTLGLTPRGRALLNSARADAQAHLARRLAALPASQRAGLAEAMETLRTLFRPERDAALEKVE